METEVVAVVVVSECCLLSGTNWLKDAGITPVVGDKILCKAFLFATSAPGSPLGPVGALLVE